ncbi:unnamed protein product [Caenorhabditis sp. 36 PRJEB53466]|nr:unnamed protein product [Caenorhabditis sp. 36 PRJEB53466]
MRVIVYYATFVVIVTAQCPTSFLKEPCTCFSTRYEAVNILCNKGEGLHDVLEALSNFSSNIDSLTISNTPMDRIPGYAFQGFRIRKLFLRNNGLREFHPNTFTGFLENFLVELEIRGNLLDKIPQTGITVLKQLEVLALPDNLIEYVQDNAFLSYHSRKSIKNLDLSANNLTAIHPTGFLGLENLVHLSLDNNLLTDVPLKSLENVQTLEDLSINVNNLLTVPASPLPLPSLISLSLEVNQVRAVNSEFFSMLSQLTYLYLGNNYLTTIQSIPFHHIIKLKVLSLSNNKDITSISSDAFGHVSSILRLELSDCSIGYIDEESFQKLQHLQAILLSGNQLTKITSSTFANLPQLSIIDLNGNSINNIEDFAFSRLPMLTSLDISSNRLETLPSHIIQNSYTPKSHSQGRNFYLQNNPWRCWTPPHLSGLDLRHSDSKSPLKLPFSTVKKSNPPHADAGNQLSTSNISHKEINGLTLVGLILGIILAIFAGCFILGYVLRINQASWTEIPPNLFSGLYIKKLDLSGNNVKFIHDRAFDGMHPVLEELSLNDNFLETVPSVALSSLTNLLRLDLSNNSIVEIQEASVFPTLNKLYDINLGSNDIAFIHTSTFQKVKNSLKIINLGHNNLSAVPSSAIRGLKHLESLHLHKNQIKQLEALNFLNLPVLNLLNLAGNQIQELNRQAFLNVPNLRYLYLSGNKIEKLSSYQFQTFEQLEMLDLTDNKISAIKTNDLTGLKHLRQLYLGDNSIKKIEPNAFTNSSIVILVLSGNKLKTLSAGVIAGLANLQQVSFRGNKIETIDRNAFYDAPSLVMLDIAQNQLTEIPPSTFIAQLNLLFVDLSNNKLKATPFAAFNQRVGTVMLKENPLVCTEEIHMLQDGNSISIKDSPDLICGNKIPVLEPIPIPVQEESETRKGLVQLPKLQIHRNKQPSAHLTLSENINTEDRLSSNTVHHRMILGRTSHVPEIQTTPPPIMLPTRQDELNKYSLDNVETTTVEKIDSIRPDRILPFPVPFLKKGPKLSESKIVPTADTLSSDNSFHTLPPSILIEPGSTPRASQQTIEAQADQASQGEKKRISEFSLDTATDEKQVKTSTSPQKSILSTVVVLISGGTAFIVFVIVVFVLCIINHRRLRFENTMSDGATDCNNRTKEYILSQYNDARPGRFEETPAWIYNPGSGYCNYYK